MEDFCKLKINKKDKLKLGSEDLTTTWQMGHICRWNNPCGYCQGDASEGVRHGPHGTVWWARRRRGGQGRVKWALSTALKSSKMEMADSGLDMISSRPKEQKYPRRFPWCGHRLLEPTDQAELGHVQLNDQQTASHPYGGLRTVSGGPWNPESWMGNIWKDSSNSEYKTLSPTEPSTLAKACLTQPRKLLKRRWQFSCFPSTTLYHLLAQDWIPARPGDAENKRAELNLEEKVAWGQQL